MNIGTIIKQIRNQKKISQKVLAQQCNITNTYLSKIELNKAIPILSVLNAICVNLGMSLAELFCIVENYNLYQKGFNDATDKIKVFLNSVEWASYSDLEKVLEKDEEVCNN